MVLRHVLRNSLLPTIAVIATQMGYLIGGLLVIEKLFNYNGIGQRIYVAANEQGLHDARRAACSSSASCISSRRSSPTSSTRCSTRGSGSAARNEHRRRTGSGAGAPVARSEASLARRETLRQLLRSKTFVVGAHRSSLFWVFWAIFGARLTPQDPLDQSSDVLKSSERDHWFGTDQLGRDVLSRVLAGARGNARRSRRSRRCSGSSAGRRSGLISGYFRGIVDDVVSRIIDAVLALPLIVIAVTALVALGSSTVDADRRDRRRLHADRRRAPCALRCSASASSSTSRPRGCAASARPT